MATKNLVPRQDLEGNLGLSSRRWAGINAEVGSIDQMKTDELLNKQGSDLIVAGSNITITKNAESENLGSQYVISSTGGGSSSVDKIFEGDEGAQTSVETIKTSTENKISFAISGDEKWFINADGHFVPRTNALDLGLSSFPVRDLYLLNDGLNLGTSNLKIDSSSKLQLGTSVGGSLVYEDVTTALEDVKFATTGAINLATDLVNNLQIDGQSLTTGDRVLVKDQATATENGIYIVAASGAASRANDLSVNSDFSAIRVTVLKGEKHSQQIFFTVPHTDGSSKTNVSNMKWVKLGSGGLEAVVDDPAPTLGGDLSVGTHSIKTSELTLEMIAKSDSATDNSRLKLQSTLNGSILSITSNDSGSPSKLSFITPSDRRLRIENVNDNFFTSNNLSSTFKYKFSPTLTTTEKNGGEAFFATQGWVSDQGYLSSTDLSSYVTTTYLNNQNFIRTADNASLTSLRLGDSYTPSNDKDAATKDYVDTYAQGLREILDPVRVATPRPTGSPINLATDLEAGDYLDGKLLVAGDRVLVKDQTNPVNNGIYIVSASGTASRSSDFASSDRVASKFVFVEQGAENANSGFICTTPAGTNASPTDVVGTDSITFAKFSAAGQISAGNGISKSGNTISANIDAATIVFDAEDNNKLKVGSINASQITGTLDEARLPNNIVADSVDENAIDPGGIDTFLTALADGDLFIVKDIDSSASIKTTKATASVLRDYIRSDIKGFTGQVDFVDDTPNSTIKSTLSTEAITGQTSYNSSPENDGPLANDDTFLVYDESATSLKKVQFSDIKAGSDLDISSYTDLIASGVTDEDQFLIRNSEDNTHRSIKVSALKEVFSEGLNYVSVTNTGTVPSIKTNTHYHISSSPTSDGFYNFVLHNVTGSAGDIIKITMSPIPFGSHFDDAGNSRFHTSKNHVVKVQTTNDASSLITLNKDNFDKPVEFILNSTGIWQTSILPANEFSYTSITSVSGLQLNDATNGQTNWAKYPAYYILDDDQILNIALPAAAQVKSWGYKQGHKKTFYFKSPNNEKVAFTSAANDILIAGASNIQVSNQTAFKLSSSSNVKKITLTLLRQAASDTLYWFFEHYIDEVGDVELPGAISAQAGDENKVLKFVQNSENEVVLSKGLVTTQNIGENAISKSDDNAQGANRIIQDNAIKKSKLEKVNPNKVLGHLGSQTSAQNVGEVNVLEGDNILNNEISLSNKHTNLVTATAIKQYISTALDSVQSEPDIINLTLVQDEIYTVMDFLPYQENQIPASLINRVCPNHNPNPNHKTSYLYIRLKSSDWTSYFTELNTLLGDNRAPNALLNNASANIGHQFNHLYDSLTKLVLPPTDAIINTLKARKAQNITTLFKVWFALDDADETTVRRFSHPNIDYGFSRGRGRRYDVPVINIKLSNSDVTAVDHFKYYGENENSQIDEDALDDNGLAISGKISSEYEIASIVNTKYNLQYTILNTNDAATLTDRTKKSLHSEHYPEKVFTTSSDQNNSALPVFGSNNNFHLIGPYRTTNLSYLPNVLHKETITRINGEQKLFYANVAEINDEGRNPFAFRFNGMSLRGREGQESIGVYNNSLSVMTSILQIPRYNATFEIRPQLVEDNTGQETKFYVYYKIRLGGNIGLRTTHNNPQNTSRMPVISN